MIHRSIVGAVIVVAALAFAPLASARQAAPQVEAKNDALVVALTPVGSFFQVGRPVVVKLTLENRQKKSVTIPNGALFGLGLKVARADGAEKKVQESAIPSDARSSMALPAGAEVSATIDLSALAPDAFARPGKITITSEIPGAAPASAEIELAKDWSGWHAVIETSLGEMELEFFPDAAPQTVANFLSLVERGFYDGLTFHRVVKGFMVQGGDPKGDGSGNSGKFIPLETGKVKHLRGVISMARQSDRNSASCQFFLCHQDSAFLDNNYAAFGRIVRGLETLDAIANVPCVFAPGGVDKDPSKPKERVEMRKIRLVEPKAEPKDSKKPGSGG